jgi:hypothetical protein
MILDILVESVRHGSSLKEEIVWDYKYASLWAPSVRIGNRRINFWKCSWRDAKACIRATYWLKRLPKSGRNKALKLCCDPKSRRKLKDIMDTCDGVLLSLLFSFPEMFLREGYALSDRIISSVMMNCFHNYSSFQKRLKELRKNIKFHGLNGLVMDRSLYDRQLSYFDVCIDILNRMSKSTSKEKFFRLACICQTRATGLAGADQMKETVEEFISLVTEEVEYNPNELLSQCIEDVTSALARQLNYGLNPNFRISMSTSACTESRKSNEGKFGFMKELVRQAGVVVPPLREGIPGTLGNWLWPESIALMDSCQPNLSRVNVVAIRENGKSRVVTTGSFWKEIALQPLSHLTLEIIKILPHLSSGLKAGRLGWRSIEKVRYDYNGISNLNWIFEVPTWRYTTDWKNATDGPSPEMAWDLTGRLLKKIGIPEEYLLAIRRYWLGPKSLFVNNTFRGFLVRGIPMGDPLTKTNLNLAHPVADLYARRKTGARAKEEGNGDDVDVITDDPSYALAHAEAAEGLGYTKSPKDEALTRLWGTYCEEWSHIPIARWNTCGWASRSGKSQLMPYIDVPKIRTLIATEKDRQDFSSDPRGKVSLLGHDEEYARKMDGPAEAIFSIASAFQDVSLATIQNRVPLFMPRQVGGVGKAPPHWSRQSWKFILQECRTWHRSYYLAAMRDYVDQTDFLISARGSRKESNHFDKEMMVEFFRIPEDDPITDYVGVDKEQQKLFPGNVLTKLVRLGYLITESEVAKYYLFQERLTELEQDTKRDLFETYKSIVMDSTFSPEEEDRILDGFLQYRDRPWLLKASRCEDLYVVDVIEALREGDPLRVTVPMGFESKFGRLPRPSSGYEIHGRELYEWFVAYRDRVILGQTYPPPPTDILEDDPIILQECRAGGADVFIIVTDDKKLVRLCANQSESCIGMMPCSDFMSLVGTNLEYSPSMLRNWESQMEQRLPGKTVLITVDSGSLDSFMESAGRNHSGRVAQPLGVPWREDINLANVRYAPVSTRQGADRWFVPRTLGQMGYPRTCLYKDYPHLFN